MCMYQGCNKKEQYICCNNSCNTRICGKCFDNLPIRRNSYLTPPIDSEDVVHADNALYEQYEDNDNEDDEDDSTWEGSLGSGSNGDDWLWYE